MKISESEIKEGLNTAAKLTNAYGDKFWPFFELLEDELENRRSKIKRLSTHLNQTVSGRQFDNA